MDRDEVDWFDQTGYRLRFGWGPNGLRRLAPVADVVVIVDVLSFSTAVDVLLGRGAVVLPYRWHDGSEDAFAADHDAVVASKRAEPGRWSLRPSSLVEVPPGTRLVLPSPNGSALTFAASDAGASRVMVGSLRNADAVAAAAAPHRTVSVIAAGERWKGTTGPLRPAVEDLFGAGAILAALDERWRLDADRSIDQPLDDRLSPEARTAVAAFIDARPDLANRLRSCGSGRELIDKGFAADVDLAADLNTSPMAPTLRGPELVDLPPNPV
ncbi:MAG: 2-phosphosulfolactate phosphatase [Actinomycetota bacterium]